MTPSHTTERFTQQIEQLRKDADEAKQAQNYEFAFILMDQADVLERQLEDSVIIYKT